MADPQKVSRALRAMAAALKRSFKSDEEEQMAVAAFAHALKGFTDEAVNLAANEWVATMKWYPAVVEFADLTRKHQQLLNERHRELTSGPAQEMIQRRPVGVPGREGLATQIVLQRMLDAVAREAPDGYLGRARGLRSENFAPGMHRSLRDLGHDFNDRGMHTLSCQRCHALAAIAYEQAVDFVDSSLTWDRW